MSNRPLPSPSKECGVSTVPATTQRRRLQPAGQPLRPGGLHRRLRPGQLLGQQEQGRNRYHVKAKIDDLKQDIKD
jgi:hypothetical protein